MFEIPQPSMALNSHNVPPPDYRMWNTRKVDKDVQPSDLLNNIASVAESATGGYLRCLVFNSHGSPGHLGMGTGIGLGDTNLFSALQGKVRTIVIVACEVAYIGDNRTCSATLNAWQNGDRFCREIAQSSQAYVFASTDLQNPGAYYILGLPLNCVDEYEGDVYRWAPKDGSCRQVDNGYITRWMLNMKIGRNPQEWK